MAATDVVLLPSSGQRRSSRVWPLPFQLWYPLSVYCASRLITMAFMIAAGRRRLSGYADLATAWDGGWYRTISTQGYPSSLPVSLDGRVEPNAWGFSPIYPLVVRGLMAVTGLPFSVVAPTLSLVLGAAAIVVIFALMERTAGRFCACATVLLTCTFMAAPVLQVAYSESLALLLVSGALLLLVQRKYVAVATLLMVLAFTRPVVLAFIPVVMAHGIDRWRKRASDPFPRGERRAVFFVACLGLMATASWPVIVGLSNQDPLAWARIQDAWRTRPPFPIGLGWPASFLSDYGLPALAMLAFIVILTLGIALRPGAKAWGPELRSWSVAYPGYLLLATVPGPSVVRWLVLAFPLMWPFPEKASSTSERRLRVIFIIALALVGLALQWVWVSTFLGATAPSDRYP